MHKVTNYIICFSLLGFRTAYQHIDGVCGCAGEFPAACHGSRLAAIYVTLCAHLLLSLSARKDSVHSNAVVLLLQC